MRQYYRIAILGVVAVLFAFLARDRVSRAIGDTAREGNGPKQTQNQPLQLPAAPEPVVQAESASPQNQSSQATVEGLVWNDLNRDGLQDLRETGIRNVTVNLYNSARALVGTATTNGNGVFRFQDLPPGDYFVSILPPEGFVFSPKDQGENELVDSDADPATAETMPVTLVAGENDLAWTTGLYSPTAAVQPEPGTVQPPPTNIDVCDPGTYSLGAISTLRVNRLAADYCLRAYLWNNGFAIGRIPGGAGRILAEVTFVEFFYQDRFVYKYDVPTETDSIQVCYFVPLGMQAQIYFWDFYGARFGERRGKPAWEPLQTTVTNNIACAVAQTSGAYALIGK
jgi:hypothetical protein